MALPTSYKFGFLSQIKKINFPSATLVIYLDAQLSDGETNILVTIDQVPQFGTVTLADGLTVPPAVGKHGNGVWGGPGIISPISDRGATIPCLQNFLIIPMSTFPQNTNANPSATPDPLVARMHITAKQKFAQHNPANISFCAFTVKGFKSAILNKPTGIKIWNFGESMTVGTSKGIVTANFATDAQAKDIILATPIKLVISQGGADISPSGSSGGIALPSETAQIDVLASGKLTVTGP